jgi:hypothetical protein
LFLSSAYITFGWLRLRDLIRLNQPSSGAMSLKDIIKSSQLLIVAAGFVFAVGGVIDAMTEGFIVRGVSTTRSIHAWLSENVIPQWEPAKIAFNVLSFLIWPPIVVICTVLSSSDHYKLLSVGLLENAPKLLQDGKISKEAAGFFKEVLSSNMQQGLNLPFCNQFDAAWQGLLAMVPEAHRQWVNGLSSRNRDLASFLSSAFFALVISSACLFGAGRWYSWATVISYVLICLISWLLFGYVSLVIRSVLAALELAAITSTSSIVR